jgi:transcription antitermination factor NusG
MEDISTKAKWQIVLTKPNCEQKVAALFSKKSIEHYCPLNTFPSFEKNPAKIKREPLFKSYVFVRIIESRASDVLKTHGVLNFVYWMNKPAVINDLEIETIRLFMHQFPYLLLEKTEVNIHDHVKSVRGSTITKVGNITEMLNNATKAILPSLGFILISQVPETEKAQMDTLILNNVLYKPMEKMVIKEQI